METEEILTEIRSIKERLAHTDNTTEIMELCVALIELQNTIIHRYQLELEEAA